MLFRHKHFLDEEAYERGLKIYDKAAAKVKKQQEESLLNVAGILSTEPLFEPYLLKKFKPEWRYPPHEELTQFQHHMSNNDAANIPYVRPRTRVQDIPLRTPGQFHVTRGRSKGVPFRGPFNIVEFRDR